MNENTEGGVVQQMFSYLSWGDLCSVAQTCTKWLNLSRAQKAFWVQKLKDEKGIVFDPALFPEGFLEAHPIDFRALYLRIRYIPGDKLFNPSAFTHYPTFVILCALLGGKTFWDALAAGKPKHLMTHSSGTSYYLVDTFAISGDLESLKRFDETSLNEIEAILEGAVKGGSLEIIEWALASKKVAHYNLKASYLVKCYGWAIEYRQHAVLDFLEQQYGQMEPVVEGDPWFCLNKAICSDSISLVERFSAGQKLPLNFLHLAASRNAKRVFWYGVNCLKLDINQLNKNGSMPIHFAVQSGDILFFRQVADHPDCCLRLKNPETRSAEHQRAYHQLLQCAAREESPSIIRILQSEYGADLSIIDPDSGNTLAHECCSTSRINVFRYLVLFGNINWEHGNKSGQTVYQLYTVHNDNNPFFFNSDNFSYYVLHSRVIEYLIKAISKDNDANDFLAKLIQYHTNHPGDIMACLALAIVFRDDNVLCQQYLNMGVEINLDQYNNSILIMNRIAHMMSNFATIDTSCLKQQSRCCLM